MKETNKTDDKTFLERKREEEIAKQLEEAKQAKYRAIGYVTMKMIIAFIITPIITVYALGVLWPSITFTWQTFLAVLWILFALKGEMKIGRYSLF